MNPIMSPRRIRCGCLWLLDGRLLSSMGKQKCLQIGKIENMMYGKLLMDLCFLGLWMHTPTTYQAWVDLGGRHIQKNTPKTNQVKHQISTLQQGSLFVINYFDKFKSLWEQLIDLDQCKSCPNCMPIYDEKQENDRIHQFLLGLNEEFMTIRSKFFL